MIITVQEPPGTKDRLLLRTSKYLEPPGGCYTYTNKPLVTTSHLFYSFSSSYSFLSQHNFYLYICISISPFSPGLHFFHLHTSNSSFRPFPSKPLPSISLHFFISIPSLSYCAPALITGLGLVTPNSFQKLHTEAGFSALLEALYGLSCWRQTHSLRLMKCGTKRCLCLCCDNVHTHLLPQTRGTNIPFPVLST